MEQVLGAKVRFSLGHVKLEESVSHPKINMLFHLVWVGHMNLGLDIM